jgi:uncharacterized damage-inducible protein DinB
MKPLLIAALVLGTTSVFHAQTKNPQGLTPQAHQTDSALTAQTRRLFESGSDNVLKAARTMPEASYSFKAVDGVRTFGELVAHIADVQATLCGNISGHRPAKPNAQPMSRDARIQALQASIGECDTAFGELSAENMGTLVQTPAGQLTHLSALLYIISHASEEYGELALYLRLNHLAPPASDEPKRPI